MDPNEIFGRPAGLSKPRFVKMRRQHPSPRVRPPASAAAESSLGFNPFRSAPPELSAFDSEGGAKFPVPSFVFGSAAKSHEDSEKSFSVGVGAASKLHEEMTKLNLQSGSNVRDNRPSGNLDASLISKLPEEMGKLKLQSGGYAGGFVEAEEADHNSKAEGSDAFASGSNTASKNSSWSLPHGVEQNLFSKLPDDTRKLNLQSASSEGGFEKAKENVHSSNVDVTNVFIFGSKNSAPGSLGTGDNNNLNSNYIFSQNVPVVSNESSFTNLSEEMRKLNLKIYGSEDDPTNLRKTGSSKSDEKNTFVSGISSGMSNPSEKGSNLSKDAPAGSCGGASSQLPDQMKKLNLQSSGNEDGFGHTNRVGHCYKADGSNAFVFGSSKSAPSSFGGIIINKLPDEMERLNIGGAVASQSTANCAQGLFMFGSIAKSFVSNQTSTSSITSNDKTTASVPSDVLHESNTNSSVHTDNLKKNTNNDDTCKMEVNTSFAFVSTGNVSGSLGGSVVDMLPDDIRKLHIDDKTESIVGSRDRVFQPSGLATDRASNPLIFTFQSGTNINTGGVPQSQSHDYCRPVGQTTYSSYSSMNRPNAESIATNFPSTRMHVELETPQMDFKTLKQDNPSWFTDNLFSIPHQNMEHVTKMGVAKSTRAKKKRGKLRQSAPHQQSFAAPFTIGEAGHQEIPEPESPSNYSPMDYSPYQETLVADECPQEASGTLDESAHLAAHGASVDAHREDVVYATQCLESKEGDRKQRDLEGHDKAHTERHFIHGFSLVSEKASNLSKNENLSFKKDSQTASKEAENCPFSSNIDRQAHASGSSFTSANVLEDFGGSSFAFGAPSSVPKRNYRRKDRAKADQDMFNSFLDAKGPLASFPFPVAGTCVHQDSTQNFEGNSFVHPSGRDYRPETSNKLETRSECTPTEAASTAAQEACEKWRLRGNQAYAKGLLMKAEDYYTCGVNSVSPEETSRSCKQALMLCYSNRAATRMSLGRMREALSDCIMATTIDPSFLKARLRAGNCLVALGETQDALKNFMKCLQSGNEAHIDKKVLSEASEGLQKAQKVANCMDESAKLLSKRTCSDTRNALDMISETLSISPQSERLIEMKAEALLLLRSYEEVIQLCQQTMDLSERNFDSTSCDGWFNIDSYEGNKLFPGRLWRWRLISKSYFYLGKLEEALDLLQKHEQVLPIMEKYRSMPPACSALSSVVVRELLRLKAAGNEAFQGGRYFEAVEHYTAALACNTESRPFTAICFCNRAAAYQTVGQITDAIADYSLAIALDVGYVKAISRRATLYELIRDYGQATNDLHRLVSLLEKQAEATGNSSDIKRACLRLSTMEEEAKRDISLDMYTILGIEPSCSAADVKKAYRKLALRHHPDKAGQFLTRSENVDDGFWKDIADKVHMDADRLFKMIGEAYTILSDPTKRLQYDAEEEMRTASRKGSGGTHSPTTPRTAADSSSSSYERSGNRRWWRDSWKSYGSSHKHYSEYSYSNG